MSYRKYDPMVKSLIIRTRNRNLFPELKIPRTTINYWLKSSKEPISSKTGPAYEACIKHIQKENYVLKATNLLISECLEKLVRELGGFDKKSKENRKFIVETVDSFKGLIPLKKIIEVIGIGPTTYYRWRVEVMGCKYNQRNSCRPASPL